MVNFDKDADVKCPFYRKGAAKFIQCEGLQGCDYFKLLFIDQKGNPKKKERDNFSHQYCECDFESCKVFKIIDGEYDNNGKKKS